MCVAQAGCAAPCIQPPLATSMHTHSACDMFDTMQAHCAHSHTGSSSARTALHTVQAHCAQSHTSNSANVRRGLFSGNHQLDLCPFLVLKVWRGGVVRGLGTRSMERLPGDVLQGTQPLFEPGREGVSDAVIGKLGACLFAECSTLVLAGPARAIPGAGHAHPDQPRKGYGCAEEAAQGVQAAWAVG